MKENSTVVNEMMKIMHHMTGAVTRTSKANILTASATLGLAIALVIHTSTVNKRFNSIETILDQQNIVQEAPITTDLPYRKLGNFELTWYCPCEKCVGKKKVVRTATGTTPKAQRTIAVDPNKIPLGSIVFIEGYGYFIAEDTGSAIKANRIDIFTNSHKEALQLGKRHANVYLLKEGNK